MQSKSTALPTVLKPALSGFLLTLSSFILSLWCAWQIAALADFGYGLGYDLLDIERHIQTYGPQNRFKPNFQLTTAAQHKQLFSEITNAVQHDGVGLESIRYQVPGGQSYTLLREPEVIHLQDVAHLISLCNWIAVVMILLFVAMLLFYRKQRMAPPKLKQIAVGTVILVSLLTAALFIIGPTATFYWLHTKIFPDNHQWFFYYQESLMTTLMKAPDLFGFIAAFWGIIAVIMFVVTQYANHKLLRRRSGH